MNPKKRTILWLVVLFILILIVLPTIFYEDFFFKEMTPNDFESPKDTRSIV